MANNIIVCQSREMTSRLGLSVVSGSVLHPCTRCRTPVFVSPATISVLEAGARPVCLDCAVRYEHLELRDMVPPSPEQLSEVKRAQGERN
jgi:hypothetical protein